MDFLNNLNLGDLGTILQGGTETLSVFVLFAYLAWRWISSGNFFGFFGD